MQHNEHFLYSHILAKHITYSARLYFSIGQQNNEYNTNIPDEFHGTINRSSG